MKAKIILTAAAFCTIFCFVANSQVEPPVGDRVGNLKSTPTEIRTTSSKPMNLPSGAGNLSDDKNLGEECSMYLDDEWKTATVILKDNTVKENLSIRYNIYTQQMQFIQNSDTLAFGNPVEIASVVFDGRTFIFSSFYCNDQVKQGYFEVMCGGECKLLLHRCIKYKYVEECSDPNTEFVKEEYFLGKKFYILRNDQPAIVLPNKKNDVVDLLSNSNVDIKSYIRENKIKINQEKDLIKLFHFYNSQI
ncbi:MAG: hypothetical protein R2764_22935 [Bacteroidales bacterium]